MVWFARNWDRVLNAAVAVFGGGAIIAFIQDFADMCAERPLQAAALAAVCMSAGFCAGKALESRRLKAEHEDALRALSKEHEREVDELREEHAEALAFAEANAKSVLAQDGEDLERVRLRQDVLSTLASIDSAKRRQEYVVEKLAGSVEDNERFGAAFRDLEKYGCVCGSRTVYFPKKGFSTAFSPDGPYVLRTDYPSLRERERRDIVIEARDEAIREMERKAAEARRREMM